MKPDKTQALSRAVIWMCIASLNFAFMSTIIRLLSPDLSGLESAVIRSVLGCVVLAIILRQQNVSIFGRHNRELYKRAINGSISNVFFFYAVSGGNLGETASLIRTSALIIPFIALWSLSEEIKLRHYLCAIAGFLGTLLIVKPGFQALNIYSVSALLCAVFSAFAWTSVRALAQKEHPGTIILYLYFFSVLSGVFAMFITDEPIVLPSLVQWGYLVLLTVVGLIAQLGLVLAYRYAPAAVISPVNYTEIAFASLLGWIIFEQTIGLYSTVGILLICLSAILIQDPIVAFRNWQRGRRMPGAVEEIAQPLI